MEPDQIWLVCFKIDLFNYLFIYFILYIYSSFFSHEHNTLNGNIVTKEHIIKKRQQVYNNIVKLKERQGDLGKKLSL